MPDQIIVRREPKQPNMYSVNTFENDWNFPSPQLAKMNFRGDHIDSRYVLQESDEHYVVTPFGREDVLGVAHNEVEGYKKMHEIALDRAGKLEEQLQNFEVLDFVSNVA